MELQEARKIVKDSSYKDFLNTIELPFNLRHINVEYNIVGIINIFKFFKENDEQWTDRKKELDNNLFSESVSFFTTARTYIDEFINTHVKNESYDESGLQQQFTSFTRHYFSPSQHVFTAKSPEIDFMIKLQAENTNIFNGAFLYFTNQGMNNSDRSSINGYLLAYEFTHRENSVLFSRRETDKRYISDIRNKIENLENDYQNNVISLIKNIENDYTKNNDFQSEKVSKSRKLLADWLHYKRNKFSSFINHTDKSLKIFLILPIPNSLVFKINIANYLNSKNQSNIGKIELSN